MAAKAKKLRAKSGIVGGNSLRTKEVPEPGGIQTLRIRRPTSQPSTVHHPQHHPKVHLYVLPGT